MKRCNKVLLLSLMSSFLITTGVYAKTNTYIIDGKKYLFDPKSINLYVNERLMNDSYLNTIIYQNSLYASVRTIFEDLGATVNFNSKTKETTVKYKYQTVVFKSNDDKIKINGQTVALKTPIKIIDNRMMIPARAIGETLGLRVDWDKKTRTAFIDEIIDTTTLEDVVYDNLNTDTKPNEIEGNTEQKPEETKPEETKPEETKPEETKPEETKPEETKPVETKPEETKPEETKPEENNPNPGNTTEEEPSYINQVNTKVKDLSIQVLEPTNYVQTNLSNYEIKDNVINFSFTNSLSKITKSISSGSNLVLEVENCTLSDAMAITKTFNNRLIKAMTIKSIDSALPKVRIMIEMFEQSSFMVHYSIDRKLISVEVEAPNYIKPVQPEEPKPEEPKPTQDTSPVYSDNVTYDAANRRIALKKVSGKPINISQIQHNDMYNKNKYILNLGSDFSSIYKNGGYSVDSEYVESFSISNNSGNTEITINENKIVVCQVNEDTNNYYIYLKPPKEVYPMIIILDPGHGGEDPGAVGNGLREKDLNTDIGNRVYDLINANPNLKAYFTKTEDYKMPLAERAYFANRNGDIFLSIHNNSSTNRSANGTDVYYYRHSNDSALGFSCKELSQIMVNAISNALGSNNRGITETAYTVVQKTTVPAALLEIGFVSNAHDAALLSTPEYRQKAAEGIYSGIMKVFETYKPAR